MFCMISAYTQNFECVSNFWVRLADSNNAWIAPTRNVAKELNHEWVFCIEYSLFINNQTTSSFRSPTYVSTNGFQLWCLSEEMFVAFVDTNQTATIVVFCHTYGMLYNSLIVASVLGQEFLIMSIIKMLWIHLSTT